MIFFAIILGMVWLSITTHRQEIIEISYKEVTFTSDEDGIVTNNYYVYTPNENIYEVSSRSNYNQLLIGKYYLVDINYLGQIYKLQNHE